jgi:hypothetical protein
MCGENGLNYLVAELKFYLVAVFMNLKLKCQKEA